jgi:hypothetical protein
MGANGINEPHSIAFGGIFLKMFLKKSSNFKK